MKTMSSLSKIPLVALLVLLLGGIAGMKHMAEPNAREPRGVGTDTCPPGRSDAREVVEDFVSSSSWMEERQEVGAIGLSPSDVHLLTDPEDTTVCQQISEAKPNPTDDYAEAYYQAGSFYFVVGIPVVNSGQNEIHLRPTTLGVYYGSNLQSQAIYFF